MGTYKHISRLRCARLIGREVASFYMLLGETQKAAVFLGDILRTFEENGWQELAAQTQLELAECHKKAGDSRKFVQACMAVSAAPEIDTLLRWTYFDEMRRSLESLNKPLIVPFANVVKIVTVSVKNDSVITQDSKIEVELVLDSNFPREVLCSNILMAMDMEVPESNKIKDKFVNCRTVHGKDLKLEDPVMRRSPLKRLLNYKEDKQLSSASAGVPKKVLGPRDSAAAPPHQPDFARSLEVNKLVSVF